MYRENYQLTSPSFNLIRVSKHCLTYKPENNPNPEKRKPKTICRENMQSFINSDKHYIYIIGLMREFDQNSKPQNKIKMIE